MYIMLLTAQKHNDKLIKFNKTALIQSNYIKSMNIASMSQKLHQYILLLPKKPSIFDVIQKVVVHRSNLCVIGFDDR